MQKRAFSLTYCNFKVSCRLVKNAHVYSRLLFIKKNPTQKCGGGGGVPRVPPLATPLLMQLTLSLEQVFTAALKRNVCLLTNFVITQGK